MTDPPPRPKRSHWRWLAVALPLFAVGILIWNWRDNRSLARRASQVAVGQTQAEVQSVLGRPHLTSFRGNGGSYYYGSGASGIWIVTALVYKYLRIGKPLPLSAFPIQVTFGDDGRVLHVRYPHQE